MNQPHDNSFFTTFSRMVGGVVKAISVTPVMIAIPNHFNGYFFLHNV
jgi:hypothetical protein